MEKRRKEAHAFDTSYGTIALPKWARTILVIVFVLIEIFISWQYCLFIRNPQNAASPTDLGLPTLFVFSSTAIFLLLLPWEKFGLRLKKIGGIEFEQIVETQATEHAEEYAEIDKRLSDLENALRITNPTYEIGEKFFAPELRKLLVDFLTQHNAAPISPLRILTWGSKQPGFERLSSWNIYSIRRELSKLVADGIAEPKLNKRGNTLYKIKE